MDLATCITTLLTLGTYLNGLVTLEECTGQGQSPEVKLGISIKKPESPAPKENLSLNNHLQSNSETKPPIENDRISTQFLKDQDQATNFEDIIVIHPINIDECDINVNNCNYTSPTKNEICNAYFKQLK